MRGQLVLFLGCSIDMVKAAIVMFYHSGAETKPIEMLLRGIKLSWQYAEIYYRWVNTDGIGTFPVDEYFSDDCSLKSLI